MSQKPNKPVAPFFLNTTRQRATPSPHCVSCGLHIGWHAAGSLCGACRKPWPLSWAELRSFARLVRKHWGDGKPRTLLTGAGGYRPALYLTEHPLNADLSTMDAVQARIACEERAFLAEFYDRMQAVRGDARRACRM